MADIIADSKKFTVGILRPENVFEEWDIYSRKKTLNFRNIDFNDIKRNAKLKIMALTGIRRSGKTSVLILLHQLLIKEGQKTGYINLEDSRIKERKDILDETLRWFGDSGYLLLDEITSAHEWDGWLTRNHEMLKGKLCIIVSSSRKSLAAPKKSLRGRMIIHELYPLSFEEFLNFNGTIVEKTTAGIGKIKNSLSEYLVYGGFPEVALTKNTMDRTRLLSAYFRDIIGLDVADLSGESIATVELFGKYVIESSYFSASKCLNFLKSLGHKIGKQSILNLENLSEESYLFFFVPIFSHTIKDRSQYPRKAYLGDTGFMNAISGKKDMGRLFENAVFLELKRRKQQNHEINYWKNKTGAEVDFIIREGLNVKEIIQASYTVEDQKTKEREMKGLVDCAKEFKLNSGLIITMDAEGKEKIDGIEISYKPLWKWLLEK